MCELNPAQTMILRLEVFTSDRTITRQQFEEQVAQRLMDAELALNADGKFRFHIHESENLNERKER